MVVIAILWAVGLSCSQVGAEQTARADPPKAIARVEPAWTEALMPLRRGAPRFCGGDGAASFPLPGDRTLWLFGDSCIASIEEVGGKSRYEAGWWMVNNVVAVGPTPSSGMLPAPGSVVAQGTERPEPGKPSGFLVPPSEGASRRWCWPCDAAILVGPSDAQRLGIFYADLARRVEEGEPEEGWNFRFVGNRIAIVANPEADPAAWRVTQHVLAPRDPERVTNGAPAISWGVVAMFDPNDAADESKPGALRNVLVFGVDGSNAFNKRAVVARVPEASIHDFAAWRFWTGTDWSQREADAAAVAEGVVDEFTIHRRRRPDGSEGEGWVMIQGEPMLGHRIFARFAPKPQGPWSTGRPLYTIPEAAADPKVIVYGAKGHPHLSAPGELLISYSVNTLDFASLERDVEIYRPRFLRVPEAMIQEP